MKKRILCPAGVLLFLAAGEIIAAGQDKNEPRPEREHGLLPQNQSKTPFIKTDWQY